MAWSIRRYWQGKREVSVSCLISRPFAEAKARVGITQVVEVQSSSVGVLGVVEEVQSNSTVLLLLLGAIADRVCRIGPLIAPGEADLYDLLSLGQCVQAGAEPSALASSDGYLAPESQV